MSRPTISVVIPTLGRQSLEAALASVVPQLGAGDEVIVVRDSHGDARDALGVAARLVPFGAAVRYAALDAGQHYYGGTAQSNHGFALATGDYVMTIGDDDAIVAGALDVVRAALEPGRATLARVFLAWNGLLLPLSKHMIRDTVNGASFLAPREHLIPFPLSGEPSADFDWMEGVIAASGRDVIWVDECLVIAGASTRDGVLANAGPAACDRCARLALREDLQNRECVICRTPPGRSPSAPDRTVPRQTIAFVWPAAEISVSDVARGYRGALVRAGHDVKDYKLHARFKYHAAALEHAPSGDRSGDMGLLAREATEGIAAFVLAHEPHLAVIISGMTFHPNGLVYLRKLGVPTVTIFTESPYDDPKQREYANTYPDMRCATQDKASSLENGWIYLPPAFDPTVHRPVPPSEEFASDVFMVATGWGDRQAILETVDWSGIDFKLYGVWSHIEPRSPIFRYVKRTPAGSSLLSNAFVAHFYASAGICLNVHRDWAGDGVSVNPRVAEVAACGGFLLTDYRQGLDALFPGVDVPTFDPATPGDLERQIRWWLARPAARREVAANLNRAVMSSVASETFDVRVQTLFAALRESSVAMSR